jgi:hypothetical protein
MSIQNLFNKVFVEQSTDPERRNTIIFGFFALVCLVVGAVLADRKIIDEPVLIGVICGLVFAFVSGQLVISYIANLWYYKYHKSEGKTRIYAFVTRDPVEFAIRKSAAIHALNSKNLKYDIYAVSHCNMFDKPDGRDDEERRQVARVNESLFRKLAELSITGNPNTGRLRVLLQYETLGRQSVENELRSRVRIMDEVATAQQKGIQWNQTHFWPRRRISNSAKDYLVVDEHVFKTVRLVGTGQQAIYIHMRGNDVADTYRQWLYDLYEFGDHTMIDKDCLWRFIEGIKKGS